MFQVIRIMEKGVWKFMFPPLVMTEVIRIMEKVVWKLMFLPEDKCMDLDHHLKGDQPGT
tara:strand:- start:119 stop:295 length:177 start_codon:yes stop_codon:yes gene_type:complete